MDEYGIFNAEIVPSVGNGCTLPLALPNSKCYRLGSLPHLKCYQRPELHHVAPSPAEVSMGMNVMHTARAEPAAFGGRLTFLFCRLQPGQERTGRCLR